MDYDVLSRVADAAMKSLVAQDTTELLGVCHRDVTLKLMNFSMKLDRDAALPHENSGSTTPRGRNAEATTPRTASKSPRGGGQQQQRTSPGKKSGSQSPRGASTNAAAAAAGSSSSAAAPAETQDDPSQAALGASSSVFRGVNDVGHASMQLLKWLQHGKYIIEPQFTTEVRRQRRAEGGGGGAEQRSGNNANASFGGSSPRSGGPKGAPANTANSTDPTTYSKVDITYGRPSFILTDTYFVSDDGLVVLIHRATIDPADQTAPAFLADKQSFRVMIGAERRGAATGTPAAVLDFSFKELRLPLDLLQSEPTAAKVHRVAEIKPQEANAHEGILFHLAAVAPKDRVLIKAKNRDGEEEAYEFSRESRTILADPKEREEQEERDLLKKLLSNVRKKYQCNSLRLCNNNFTDLSKLMPLLPNIVVNMRLTITWLDLSCNQISVLPAGMNQLPLTTLYLHSNNLSEWADIKREVCSIKGLTVVTLYGNPIATRTPNYRHHALGVLLDEEHHGENALNLKSFDFVAVTGVDRRVSGMLQQFTGGVEKHLARLASPPKRRAPSPSKRK